MHLLQQLHIEYLCQFDRCAVNLPQGLQIGLDLLRLPQAHRSYQLPQNHLQYLPRPPPPLTPQMAPLCLHLSNYDYYISTCTIALTPTPFQYSSIHITSEVKLHLCSIGESVIAAKISHINSEDVVAIAFDVVLDWNRQISPQISSYLHPCVFGLSTFMVPNSCYVVELLPW